MEEKIIMFPVDISPKRKHVDAALSIAILNAEIQTPAYTLTIQNVRIPNTFVAKNPIIDLSFHEYMKAILSPCNRDLSSQHVMSKISLRILIDKEQQRVVFAEAGSDFVDVLFSFLTLPLGRIVQLLGKQTRLGSLDKLYESVEQLDAQYLQTEACKEMLLNPRSATVTQCEDLKIKNIHDDDPRNFYFCNESHCLTQSKCYYTYEPNVRCNRCGKEMDAVWNWSKGTTEGGVFVKDRTDFIITDDLRVKPISLMSGFSLLEELRIKDASILEERVIDVDSEWVLNLLRRSLISKRALTEFFFPDTCIEPRAKCFLAVKEEIDAKEDERQINVKIVLNKKKNIVLYAEVGEEFVDQLLSFLTFPFGFVFSLLGKRMSLEGCINNLYSSTESLGLERFKSEECKNMLMFPKLPSYYGCRNQILKLDEMTSKKMICTGSCLKCFQDNGWECCLTTQCKHGLKEAILVEQNPKLQYKGSDSGQGFVVEQRTFMVADNLHISPISSISAITNGIDFLISDLVEKDVSVDKVKVLSLLSAMLISKTVLTDVFSPKATQRRRSLNDA